MGIGPKRSQPDNIVSGQTQYELPDDRMGTTIQSVQVLYGTDASTMVLYPRYVDHETFSRLYNEGTLANDAGLPQHWTYNPQFPQQILLRPVPNFNRTDGLVVNYSPLPTQLFRVYNQTIITANPTTGSTTVTLSANITTGQIQEFDEFGIITPLQGDGTTASDPTVNVWTRIAGVAPGTPAAGLDPMVPAVLTLSSAFLQPGGAGQQFITAQVTNMEITSPGSLRHAPAYMAAADFLMITAPQTAEILNAKVAEILEEGRPKQPPQNLTRDFSPFTRGVGGIYGGWPTSTQGGNHVG
jgi:hypothetical protein